jgi:hypothetical protein
MKTIEDLRKLLEELDSESNELLLKEELFDFLSYGWKDYDTPNYEDYFGNAIWQVDAPYKPSWGWEDPDDTEPALSDKQFDLHKNGIDFVGTMDFARRSIGQALCYAAIKRPEEYVTDDREFWHEYATAIQWLYISSDRLLLFFRATGVPKPKKKDKKSFSSFFEAPVGLETDPQQKMVLGKLLNVALIIEALRDDRNEIVHEIATRSAQQSIAMIKNREARKKNPSETEVSSEVMAILTSDLSPAVENMKKWYLTLVSASNLIFEYEFWKRQHA